MTRYDAVVALVFAVACVCAMLGRTRALALAAAWASLGVGAAVKLVPALAALPLALLGDRGEGRLTPRAMVRTTWGSVIFLSVAAVFFLPVILVGDGGLAESFAYHADRGLQLESLGASVLMSLGWTTGSSYEYGAMEVHGRGAEFLVSMSLPITGFLLAVTAVAMYFEHRGGRFGPEQFPRFVAAFVLAFLLGSKVLSPQYVIWLLPLVPLSAEGAWAIGVSGIFLAACWATTQIYVFRYDELMDRLAPATDILLGRNLLLAILWALLLVLPVGSRSGGKPATAGQGAATS